jgi:4'-phosphopantetheinyl transferase
VHIHYVALGDGESAPSWCAGLLSDEEKARGERYLMPKSRLEHLVARALVRTTLSRYCDVAPRDWTFRENEHGRPDVDGPAGAPPLRFNLSHTHGLVACAVVLERELGIDVEDASHARPTLDIADRFFAPSEVAALHAVPEALQRERFFAYWTLKESYIKARGMGLAIPLHHFAFELDRGANVSIAFAPELDDDPSTWQFERARPTERHSAALAVRRGKGPDLTVVASTPVRLGEWRLF